VIRRPAWGVSCVHRWSVFRSQLARWEPITNRAPYPFKCRGMDSTVHTPSFERVWGRIGHALWNARPSRCFSAAGQSQLGSRSAPSSLASLARCAGNRFLWSERRSGPLGVWRVLCAKADQKANKIWLTASQNPGNSWPKDGQKSGQKLAKSSPKTRHF